MSGLADCTEGLDDESFDDWGADAERYAAQALAQTLALRQQKQTAPSASHANGGRASSFRAAEPPAMRTPAPIPCQNKPGHFPALISRSSLFPVARLDRENMKPDAVAKSQGTYYLKMSGPALTMLDKSVWEAVIDLAKKASLDMNESLKTSLSEIARRIGNASTGSRVLDAVWESLQRLSQAAVEATLPKGIQCAGKMLASADKDATGVRIRLDPKFASALLGMDYQFVVDSARRRTLDGALAQWLHDFLSTHEQSTPLTLKYLRELCGYAAHKRRFPESLGTALALLAKDAPTLVLGHAINRGDKDSDSWTVEIHRGAELPSFQQPAKTGTLSAAHRPKRGRGGVAL